MPTLSLKGVEIPASPIRKLVPYAEAAKTRGVKVYHLNIGQPDIETPKVSLNALRDYNLSVIEYGHSAGQASYRHALVDYYKGLGISLESEHILITTGGSEALTFAFQACLDAGDEVIVPEPFYTNYYSFSIQANVKLKPITTSIENGFALPNIDEFEQLISPKTKAILLCNPNNPTGYLYSRDELEQLRELVLKHDLYLICDEVYREFCYDGATHFSCLNLQGVDEHVILIDSTSKRYSMCGVRVGALITRNEAVFQSVLRFCQARLCAPVLGQFVAEAALRTPQSYFDEVHYEYTERRNFLVNALNAIPGVFCPQPKGAFYTIVRLPVANAEHFAQWLLEDFNYEQQTVMIAPAAGFYATPGLGINEARIAYVLQIPDLEKACICLAEALKVYPYRQIL